LNDVFQVLEINNYQPRVLFPANLSFKINGEIKITLKQFMSTKPELLKILKGILYTGEKERQTQILEHRRE
jgi:hypothetical protein